jgi:citrate synthase
MIGYIYRIQHTQSELCYIGSTMNELKHRWQQHKCLYQRWKDGKQAKAKCSIFKYFEEHGIEQFKCFLVKTYEVIDRQHLEAYETLWIKKLKGCNEKLPFAIKKLTDRSAYAKNRESRCAQVRAYAAANNDAVKERTKQYRNKNKEVIKARKAIKTKCECGGSWAKGNGFPRHERTKRHQHWIETSAHS